MQRLTPYILIALALAIIAFVTLPFWGMGPAVFLDSERSVISRAVTADGKRTAQVERIVVGGVPSIVVMVRPSWMPNWYLAGCAAASHYEDTPARIRWKTDGEIEVGHSDSQRFWKTGSAPFHNDRCKDLIVTFHQDV